MRLGDVLRKERERKTLSVEAVATNLRLSADEYQALETGMAPIEAWGLKLGRFAMKLKTPTARLISESGRWEDAARETGQCGKLVRRCREKRGLTQQSLAAMVDMTLPDLVALENGKSGAEIYAPLLLGFAQLINQPIFNLLYPSGLPLDKLEDYN